VTAGAGAHLHRTAIDIGRVPRTGMITAAKTVKTIATQEIAPYARFTKNRAGRGPRRIRLRAVDDIRDVADGATCRIQGVPVGLWVIANSGADAHQIPKARKGKARQIRYLKGDRYEHPIGRPVHHPGTSGRHVWGTVVTRAQRVVPQVFRDELHRAVT